MKLLSMIALSALASLSAAAYEQPPTPPDVRQVSAKATLYRYVTEKKGDFYVGSGELLCEVEAKVGVYDVRSFAGGYTIPAQNEIGRCRTSLNGQEVELVVTGKVQLRNGGKNDQYRKLVVSNLAVNALGGEKIRYLQADAGTDDENNATLVTMLNDSVEAPKEFTRFEEVSGEVEFRELNK